MITNECLPDACCDFVLAGAFVISLVCQAWLTCLPIACSEAVLVSLAARQRVGALAVAIAARGPELNARQAAKAAPAKLVDLGKGEAPFLENVARTA